MADIYASNWNETDANNNSAAPDGAPEGMPPSGVDDTMRAMMGAMKRFVDQQTPKATDAGGTSTAYTLTYSVAPTALADGMLLTLTFDKACGEAPTLNVNALGAKPLKRWAFGMWISLAPGDVIAGQLVRVHYDQGSGTFRILHGTDTTPTGSTLGSRGTSSQLPPGWVIENGASIGDASSGATGLASAGCEALFKYLWPNANYQMQNSAGTNVARGVSANADWTAHSRMVLSNMSGQFRAWDGSSSAGVASGSSSLQGGTTSGSLPVSVSGSFSTLSNGDGAWNAGMGSGGASVNNTNHQHTVTGGVNSSGSTSGALAVSGTVNPPHVSEIPMIKL